MDWEQLLKQYDISPKNAEKGHVYPPPTHSSTPPILALDKTGNAGKLSHLNMHGITPWKVMS
jgi:hypothetical protein